MSISDPLSDRLVSTRERPCSAAGTAATAAAKAEEVERGGGSVLSAELLLTVNVGVVVDACMSAIGVTVVSVAWREEAGGEQVEMVRSKESLSLMLKERGNKIEKNKTRKQIIIIYHIKIKPLGNTCM